MHNRLLPLQCRCFAYFSIPLLLRSLSRRPLSCHPRNPLFRAACSAYDDIQHTRPFSQRSDSHHSHNPTSSSSGGTGKVRRRPSQQPSDAESVLGPGFKGNLLRDTGSLGGYNQIFPSPVGGEERRRYLKIMATASDCYADQRCGCAWCSRRLRARHMASTALEIFNATGNARHRPFSASPTVGSSSSNGVRPSSSSSLRSLSEQSCRIPERSLCRAESVPSPSKLAPRTASDTPAVSRSCADGADSITPDGEGSSSRSPTKPAASYLSSSYLSSSKMDRHLARYLKALYSSSSRARRAPQGSSTLEDSSSSNNAQGDQQAASGPMKPSSGSSSALDPPKVLSGVCPPQPSSSSSPHPLVPRVARLASARGASARSPAPDGEIDHQIQAMRVVTGALLSNSFVSCYSSGLKGRQTVRSASAKRVSAKPTYDRI